MSRVRTSRSPDYPRVAWAVAMRLGTFGWAEIAVETGIYERTVKEIIKSWEKAGAVQPVRAWRPGGMYLIGFLMFWNAIGLHVLNAIFKTALPPMPWDILLGIAGLYFSLYMGGHTVKEVVGKWVGK